MQNYNQPGDVLDLTAPAAVSSGDVVQIKNLLVVAEDDADSGATFPGRVKGVCTLPKTTGTAWAEGEPLYFDLSAEECHSDPAIGPYIGVAADAAASGDATGKVKLKGAADDGAVVKQVRKRFTIAQVNAGAELLPAIPGLKYRMVDAIMIAVGGAVAAVTTVDILGTQTTAAKLVAAAQAGLTQSTVVRAGDSTGAVLADGASFEACDANTAITLGKTGSAITTATHIDVVFSYALDI